MQYPVIFGGAPHDKEKDKKLDEALGFLDGFLGKTEWAAGDSMTLADLALLASVTTIEVVGYDFSKHSNVTKWLAKAKAAAPGYEEANGAGAKAFKGMFEALTKK